MMKKLILAILVGASAEVGAAQEVAYLDLTDIVPRTELRHPTAPPLKCNSDHTCTGNGSGSVSVSVGCGGGTDVRHALRTNLMWMDRIEYTDGERAEIEVQIQNVGEGPQVIPWSPHLSDLQPTDEKAKFQAQNLLIGLFLHWGEGYSESLGWIYLYRVSDRKETMLTLLPGEWARVRGAIDIEFDHADGFVLPLPDTTQSATAELELQNVVYTPVAGGVDLNIAKLNLREVPGNVMAIDVQSSNDKALWLRRLKASETLKR